MRMIDADKLIAQMEEDAKHMDDATCQMMTYAAINDVKKQPVIDIVRCGECKHKFLQNDVWVCPFGLMITPNGFCNYGERRADE